MRELYDARNTTINELLNFVRQKNDPEFPGRLTGQLNW